jgi:hypothetical protein
MATRKTYAYYIEGNKIGLAQKETDTTSTDLRSEDYGRYKSPQATVADGLEIKYTYIPDFNIQSTGNESTDFLRFLGWGSDGTNLIIFTFSGASTVVNVSLFAQAGSWIYIEGSGRWSGIHKVKAVTSDGIMTLETKCNLGPSKIQVTGTFEADDNTFIGDDSSAIVDIETFKDNMNAKRSNPYIWIDDAAHGSNHGLFSLTENTTSGKITLNKKFSIDTDGDYTETDAACADGGNDTVAIYNVFYEQLSVYDEVEKMEDETFELDLPRYLQNAVVYYLKAKMFEDMGDFEKREFYLREFKRQVEKHNGGKVTTTHRIQGFWGMNQKL